jgi:hypothetical protein
MKRQVVFISAAIVLGLALVISSLVLAQASSDNQLDSAAQANPGQSPAGDDSNPVGTPEVIIPVQFQPSLASSPQTTGPVTTVYFTPQDENTSTTVLFLYNTSPVTATVGLKTFYINGSLTISTTVSVPPNGLLRMCADSVTTVSASWANYVLVNFTTFSAYAKMTLPAGVKADGYVAWDTTGIYDPLTAVQVEPLRFSIDPPTVFLPTIQH